MEITTTAGALLAGLVTSVHCAGMCGPIACGIGTLARSEKERLIAATVYHGARLFSYSLIGAVCGMIGKQPLQWFFDSPAVLLPWALVVGLIFLAFGLDKKIPRPAILNRFTARNRFKASAHGPTTASALMGFFTPLLPCGPLYVMFGIALLSSNAARGAEFGLAFGLGTVPLLWLAQHQFHRLRLKLSPLTMSRLQRGLAFVTALIMAWRLHDTIPLMNQTASEKKELPSCCHEE
jgi:sulfite exporter TauE/SafE